MRRTEFDGLAVITETELRTAVLWSRVQTDEDPPSWLWCSRGPRARLDGRYFYVAPDDDSGALLTEHRALAVHATVVDVERLSCRRLA